MSAQHTPGPWKLQDHPTLPCEVYTEDFDIGTVYCTDTPRGRADAALIASAPALLAALQEAHALMPLGTAKRAEWMSRARSAIAQANGGEA